LPYWNQQRAKILLEEYVEYLRFRDWNDDDILADLNGNMMRETIKVRSWSQWRDMMEEIVGQDAEEE